MLYGLSMEEGAACLKKVFSLPDPEEAVLSGLLAVLRDAYYYEIQAKNGIKELMEALKNAGVRMDAATAGSHELAEHALERNGLRGYLETIVSCS